jgi:hypothetical protein
MRFLYKDENDRDARPPYIRDLFMDLPAGTRIDEAAVPVCNATDADIKAQGINACARETLMAKGTLVARPGTFAMDPFVGDVYFFHAPGHWLEMVTARGSPSVIGYDKFYIEGSRLRAAPASTPGGFPDGETAIREVTFTMAARVADGRSFFTTPPSCPADGSWVTRSQFTFQDGVPDPIDAVSRCTTYVAAPVDVVVLPKRVRRGRRTNFEVRLAPAGSLCARGATVALGGAKAVTGEDGRAKLRTRLTKVGLAKATVTRSGCSTLRKSVRVLR